VNDASLSPPVRARLREFDTTSGECGALMESTLTRLRNRKKK
jgi:hypothetical protein